MEDSQLITALKINPMTIKKLTQKELRERINKMK